MCLYKTAHSSAIKTIRTNVCAKRTEEERIGEQTLQRPKSLGYTVKLSPQPHCAFAFGLLKVNSDASSLSLKSIVLPSGPAHQTWKWQKQPRNVRAHNVEQRFRIDEHFHACQTEKFSMSSRSATKAVPCWSMTSSPLGAASA